nr:LamG domain-containing protein [Akkermansiaceae bacterium]
MRSLHEAFPGEFAANFAGFTTDSPYAGYQKWGGAETHPDALLHRQKIILYERWLQQRGRGHDFIANSAGGTDFAGIDTTTQAGRDQWDMVYKNGSLRAIQLHQLEGGRPDRVLFESWYDGPFTMVPESRAGSFANLALDGLKYLKGPGQNLDLLWRRDDEGAWAGEAVYQQQPQGVQARVWTAADHGDRVVFQVRLVNRGEVAALPVIHAHESGADGWALAYQLAGADITAAVRAAEGLPLTAGPLYSGNELIAPGAAVDLELVIDAPAPAGPREVLLRAFWNPQDPSNAPRDALALTLLPPPDPPADAALGHWPFDSGLADVSGWRRHLTAAGGSTTGAPPVKVGAAALQAGAAGARAATAAAVPLGDAFTVAAWVYLPAGPGSVRTIAANSVSGFNANGFRFFANTFNTSDGKLILETGNGSQAAALASPAGTLATGRWQH